LESIKVVALCSLITGLVFRCLPGTASTATAGNDARRTTSALRRPRSHLQPYSLIPGSASLRDGPGQNLASWSAPDEPATAPMLITQATVKDLPIVLGLINEASAWLRTKETDQWTKPWPTEEERDLRVLTGLRNGKTWIVWDGDVAAATVTIANSHNPDVWDESGSTCDLSEKAVYVHRLITARKYAGTGLGTELINWAGLRGKRKNRAKWIRIDVWTSNLPLHAYYESIGFASCGTCSNLIYLPGSPSGLVYPSGALFQKPTSVIRQPARRQFTERADLVVRDTDRQLVGAGQSAG